MHRPTAQAYAQAHKPICMPACLHACAKRILVFVRAQTLAAALPGTEPLVAGAERNYEYWKALQRQTAGQDNLGVERSPATEGGSGQVVGEAGCLKVPST